MKHSWDASLKIVCGVAEDSAISSLSSSAIVVVSTSTNCLTRYSVKQFVKTGRHTGVPKRIVLCLPTVQRTLTFKSVNYNVTFRKLKRPDAKKIFQLLWSSEIESMWVSFLLNEINIRVHRLKKQTSMLALPVSIYSPRIWRNSPFLYIHSLDLHLIRYSVETSPTEIITEKRKPLMWQFVSRITVTHTHYCCTWNIKFEKANEK